MRRDNSAMDTSVRRAFVTGAPDWASRTRRRSRLASGWGASAATGAAAGSPRRGAGCAVTGGGARAAAAETPRSVEDLLARTTAMTARPRSTATLPTRTARIWSLAHARAPMVAFANEAAAEPVSTLGEPTTAQTAAAKVSGAAWTEFAASLPVRAAAE